MDGKQEEFMNDEWFRSQAKALYHEDGAIEVDANALVSVGKEQGAYVQAWVWVPTEAIAEEEPD